MNQFLKSTVMMAAAFALAAIGFCAIRLAKLAVSAQANISSTANQIQQVAARTQAAVQDIDRTVLIASGAINEARRIERDNREEIAAVNRQTLISLQHVDNLVVSFDNTQQEAGAAIANNSAALTPVIAQTEQDLRAIEPAIEQVAPLLVETKAIAGNLNATTADIQHEIHRFVYPPPRKWYQKYFLDPVKIAAKMVTIPLR